ncbi:MFS transporter [Mycolicibacterium smegmatis]|nr:MFS transporter [Mycolicibacterium smegmatis]
MAGQAVSFTSLYLSAGALMPLLVYYQGHWSLSASDLTTAFAVYAVGFLGAALTVGSLSDRVGRRPVLLGALIIHLASGAMFLVAPNVDWLIAARVVQGAATGTATAAFTASLVELAPAQRKRVGATLGSIGLAGGLAMGSLLGGLAIEISPDANTIIFGTLTVLTAVGIFVVGASPETVDRNEGALRALIPRVEVPRTARTEFVAAAPVVASVWMLAGLSGGMAPSLVHSVFHSDSGVIAGLSGFAGPATSAMSALAFAAVDTRRAMIVGCCASLLGAAGMIGGVESHSLVLMIIGQAVAGAGFGAGFTAALGLVLPLAAPPQRAGTAAAIYIVAYLAFGVPIVIAGRVASSLGEAAALVWFSAATVLLAVAGLRAQLHAVRRARNDAHRTGDRAAVVPSGPAPVRAHDRGR